MQTLKKLLGGLTSPPISVSLPPVEAENSFASMVFSAVDDEPKPSKRLIDLSLDAARLASAQVSLDDIAARPDVPDYFTCWPGEHYRLLGGLLLTLRPAVVIEIGSFTGLSALTMLKYLPPQGRLVTFDLTPWQAVPSTLLTEQDFASGRLAQILGDLADPAVFEQHRELLESADFFFIDGPKDDRFEWKLMDHLRTLGGTKTPILMFDDTRLWSMLRFCRMLPHPKLDITSFGHWSGTMLAELTR